VIFTLINGEAGNAQTKTSMTQLASDQQEPPSHQT